jgi:hypothetical protein
LAFGVPDLPSSGLSTLVMARHNLAVSLEALQHKRVAVKLYKGALEIAKMGNARADLLKALEQDWKEALTEYNAEKEQKLQKYAVGKNTGAIHAEQPLKSQVRDRRQQKKNLKMHHSNKPHAMLKSNTNGRLGDGSDSDNNNNNDRPSAAKQRQEYTPAAKKKMRPQSAPAARRAAATKNRPHSAVAALRTKVASSRPSSAVFRATQEWDGTTTVRSGLKHRDNTGLRTPTKGRAGGMSKTAHLVVRTDEPRPEPEHLVETDLIIGGHVYQVQPTGEISPHRGDHRPTWDQGVVVKRKDPPLLSQLARSRPSSAHSRPGSANNRSSSKKAPHQAKPTPQNPLIIGGQTYCVGEGGQLVHDVSIHHEDKREFRLTKSTSGTSIQGTIRSQDLEWCA